MSAFSCGPGRGSEPGVGWNVAIETARLGHDVTVLTQSEFAPEIEKEVANGELPPGLRFDIYMPRWLAALRDFGLRHGQPALTWHLTSLAWQFCALLHVRRRYRDAGFDLIHHVTFAGIRHPTLLTFLNIPTVLGPLGGGDAIPFALRKSFPWKYWLVEFLRGLHNWSLRADPMTRAAFHRAQIIFLRTEAAMVAVPRRDRGKVRVRVGLGVADVATTEPVPRRPGEPLHLLYAGALLYLKGIHLGLRALAHARAEGADTVLTIVGDGPARGDLERLVRELGLTPHVTFCGQVTRQHLLHMYRDHHVMLFPSLRDAGGMVVLEAWSQALPVICFALGGPGKMVDETCGRVVRATSRSEAECAVDLADAIVSLATDERLRLSLGHGAIARYRHFSWPEIVAGLYGEIDARLQRDTPPAAKAVRFARPRQAAAPQAAIDPGCTSQRG
ncbi:MAG: glycosyltransferase family 4 protein [Variibacter sp.]